MRRRWISDHRDAVGSARLGNAWHGKKFSALRSMHLRQLRSVCIKYERCMAIKGRQPLGGQVWIVTLWFASVAHISIQCPQFNICSRLSDGLVLYVVFLWQFARWGFLVSLRNRCLGCRTNYRGNSDNKSHQPTNQLKLIFGVKFGVHMTMDWCQLMARIG